MSRSILVIALFSLGLTTTAFAAGLKTRSPDQILRSISAQSIYRTTDDIGEIVNSVAAEREREVRDQAASSSPKSAQKAPPPSAALSGSFAKVIPSPHSSDTARGSSTPPAAISADEAEIHEVIAILSPDPRSVPAASAREQAKAARRPMIEMDGESAAPLQAKTHKELRKASAAAAAGRAKSPNGLYTYGPTRLGMTLAEVAANVLPSSDVTIAQMMWAIYQKNKQAFANQDIRTLKPKSTLHVPELDEVTAIGRTKAEAEIARLQQPPSRTASTRLSTAL